MRNKMVGGAKQTDYKITGFTANHVNGSNRKGVVNFSNIFADMMQHFGMHTDKTFVFINNPDSRNSSNILAALDILENEDCIICLDDWNIKAIYSSFKAILEGKIIGLSHPNFYQRDIEQHLGVISRIVNGKFDTIFPAYKHGNHELLNIPGKSFAIDPTFFMPIRQIDNQAVMFPATFPIHASLVDKGPWLRRNFKDTKYINAKGISEQEVFRLFYESKRVITPPHYHVGSGWFRNRFEYAIQAKALNYCDREEGLVFGQEYPLTKEEFLHGSVSDLYDRQYESYKKNIMSEYDIHNTLGRIEL